MATWMVAAHQKVSLTRLSSSITTLPSQAAKLIQRRNLSDGGDHHGPPKVNREDPLSPSKWKKEHASLVITCEGEVIYFACSRPKSYMVKTESGSKVKAPKTRIYKKWKEHTGLNLLREQILKTIIEMSREVQQAAKDPSGKEINTLAQHIQNLLCPSTPFFFNTLYDLYSEGADFVRGHPFSLREGVPTTVFHGLWFNIPDYDAPTQLVKPRERNTRFVDAVLTIPKGILFPMCGMYLALPAEPL